MTETTQREIDIAGITPCRMADQPRPMLQWVKIAAMVIDDRYQRPLNAGNWKSIRSIAADFRWARFTPVLLAPIEGGRYAVIDGQHRVHAAALCGIKSVPAMIVLIAVAEQASAFIEINRARTAVTPLNIYRAALASGEAWAIKARDAVQDGGCMLMEINRSTKDKKPGQVFCVGFIRKLVERGAAAAITTVLAALRETDASGNVALYSDYVLGPIMSAAAFFPGLTVRDLAAVLRAHRAPLVIAAAERLAEKEGIQARTAATDAFKTLIRMQLEGRAKVAA